MKIGIIGTGYVGLPTALVFAQYFNKVVCYDKDRNKIEMLKNGESPIYEQDITTVLHEVGDEILFTTDPKDLGGCEVIFITVGTPMQADGSANIDYILNAAQDIKENNPKAIVVLKSTVPVGTCRKVSELLPEAKIASMPEFMREGYALNDVACPDRIIIGTPDDDVYNKLVNIYPKPMHEYIHRIYTWESSELIKYASNAFLATKIHFANELADLCEVLGANIKDVTFGMGLDSRIGSKFLKAGVGYGGSCFPKDTNALAFMAEQHGIPLRIVNEVIRGNKLRQMKCAEEINIVVDSLNKAFGGAKIAMLGLAFKEGTDDVRESPAINVLERINYPVTVYDPKAMDNTKKILKKQDVSYAGSIMDCIKGANIILVATEWKEFAGLKIYLDKDIKFGIVYDLKNILDSDTLKETVYTYKGIGYGKK